MNKFFAPVRSRLLLGLAVLAITGCSSTSPPVNYYSLVDTKLQPSAVETDEQLLISVGPVTLPDLLKKTQIATSAEEGRYQISDFNRWTGQVDRELARAVAEQLSVLLGTQKIAIFPWEQYFEPTRRVLIDVLAMGGELGKEANLVVRWTLIDPQGKVPPLTRRSLLSDAPIDAGYPAWVAAQQRNIANLSSEIATALQP